jgi:hypothetical protein
MRVGSEELEAMAALNLYGLRERNSELSGEEVGVVREPKPRTSSFIKVSHDISTLIKERRAGLLRTSALYWKRSKRETLIGIRPIIISRNP